MYIKKACIALVFIIVILNIIPSSAQHKTIRQLINKSVELGKSGDIPDAISLSKMAISLAEKENKYDSVKLALTNIGALFAKISAYQNQDSSLFYMESALEIEKNEEVISTVIHCYSLSQYANLLRAAGKPDTALYLLLQCKENLFKLQIEPPFESDLQDRILEDRISTLIIIGDIYKSRLDLENALFHYQLAEYIAERSPFHRGRFLHAVLFSRMGEVYFASGDNSLAVKYSKRFTRTLDSLNLPIDYAISLQNTGTYFRNINKDSAVYYYKQSIPMMEDLLGENHPAMGRFYENMGIFYARDNQEQLAVEFAKKAQQNGNFQNEDGFWLEYYLYKGNVDSAEYFARKLYHKVKDELDITSNDKIDFASFDEYQNHNIFLARIKRIQAQQEKNKEIAKVAVSRWKKVLEVYQVARELIITNEGIDLSISNQKRYLNQFISTLSQFDFIDDYKHELVTFIDQLNSYQLQRSRGITNFEESKVVESMWAKRNALLDSLKQIDKKLVTLGLDDESYQIINTRRLSVLEEVDKVRVELLGAVDTDANDQGINLATSLSQSGEESVVGLYLSEKTLVVYKFDKGQLDVSFYETTSDLFDAIDEFNLALVDPNTKLQTLVKKQKQLVNKLYFDHWSRGFGKTVSIQAPGKLEEIPFDLLAADLQDFSTIGYNIRIIKALRLIDTHPNTEINQIALFGINNFDDYNQSVRSENQLPKLRSVNSYDNLDQALVEVENIRSLFSGISKVYKEADANIINLQQSISTADILHFATHAIVDFQNSFQSGLILKDSVGNDIFFTAQDIRNLEFDKTQLIFLSACQTGTGPISRSEGLLSLAYYFLSSGTDAVVMTRWKIPDETTPLIVENFYENLKKGQRKSEALKNAQRAYVLNQEDPLKKHPYYWAGFVVIGDDQPIKISQSFLWWWLISAVLLLMIIIFYFNKRKSRTSI